MELEKICSAACYVAGAVFMLVAIFGFWPHVFTMSVCFATGFLVSEEQSSRTP